MNSPDQIGHQVLLLVAQYTNRRDLLHKIMSVSSRLRRDIETMGLVHFRPILSLEDYYTHEVEKFFTNRYRMFPSIGQKDYIRKTIEEDGKYGRLDPSVTLMFRGHHLCSTFTGPLSYNDKQVMRYIESTAGSAHYHNEEDFKALVRSLRRRERNTSAVE